MGENENQFEEFSDLNQEPVTIQAPPEEPPKKSSKASVIISFVLIGALLIGSIVIGATTLSKKSKATEQNIAKSIETESGTWTQFRAYYATAEIVEYSHKYFYVIPVATEHFFLVASNDGSHYAVIRADKNWYEKNFTDGVANDPDGYLVEGYVRKRNSKSETRSTKRSTIIRSCITRSLTAMRTISSIFWQSGSAFTRSSSV